MVIYNRSIAADDSWALDRELFFGSFIIILKPIDLLANLGFYFLVGYG
jgi:hypothetical protein